MIEWDSYWLIMIIISAFESNYGYAKIGILMCQLHLWLMYKNHKLIAYSYKGIIIHGRMPNIPGFLDHNARYWLVLIID
jgi:hypothetical protein